MVPKVEKFVIKYSIISSMIIWIAATHMKDFGDCLIDNLLKPLFSLDLDNNGEPDLEQMKKFVVNILGIKFPLGKILMGLIKIMLHLVLIYYFVFFIIRYTHLVRM